MRFHAASALLLAFVLGGCNPGEQIVLAEDAIEAARTCFVVESFSQRREAGGDAPLTLETFNDTIAYPIAAAAMVSPFDVDNTGRVIEDLPAEAERIASMDWEGAIATCEDRFGIGERIALPASEDDAALSCYAITAFITGTLRRESSDFNADVSRFNALAARLEPLVRSSSALTSASNAQGLEMVTQATRSAFSAGNPIGYINACERRFPAH